MYARLRESTQVHHIHDADGLTKASLLLQSAYACAIDAEWQPGTSTPSATLVQLALRHDTLGSLVLLLDLLSLPSETSRRWLQSLFRDRGILKVGYGLSQDLTAISTALGTHGQECVAVVRPCIDLRHLSRVYPITSALSASKGLKPGLAGLVHALLGQPLDKTLQCSAWERRPLSQAQIDYAALDAACLLGILAECGRAHLGDAAAPASRTGARPDLQNGRAQAAASGGAGTPMAVRRALAGTAQPPGSEPDPALVRTDSENASLATPSDSIAARLGALGIKDDGRGVDGQWLSREMTAAVRDAWGCRLESTGGRGHLIPLSSNRLQSKPHAGPHDELSRLPVAIPWAKAEGAAAAPRFVADVPQEGLARQLRLCGFDTKVAPNLSKGKRHLVYRFLVETAEREARVILTGDRLFVRRRLSDSAFLVSGLDKKAQLADVLSVFGLRVGRRDMLSRCAKCNGTFVPRPMWFSELPEGSRKQVPASVVAAHDAKFWVCGDCGQVYWRGSQFEKCLGDLSARLSDGPVLAQA